MARIPSFVVSGDSALGNVFPTFIPEPEKLVYEYVVDAAAWRIPFPQDGRGVTLPANFSTPPTLALFADRGVPYQPDGTTDSLLIPVVRGWPEYPGQVPGIGVAQGTESEDAEQNAIAGGFAGEAYAFDALRFPDDGSGLTFAADGSGLVFRGKVVGTCDYFAQPLYEVVVVELVHENRDERDRQHLVLKRILQPLRRVLPLRDARIHKVQVDATKDEVEGGPSESDQPLTFYVSIFTVQVWAEMLEAVDVRGADVIEAINVTVAPDAASNYQPAALLNPYDA